MDDNFIVRCEKHDGYNLPTLFVMRDGELLSEIDLSDKTEIDLSDTISDSGNYLIYAYAYTDGVDWEWGDNYEGRVSNLIEYTVD